MMIKAWQIAFTAALVGLPAQQMWGHPTTLGIEGTRFTVNGNPRFLLGFSYYGGLGAPEEFVTLDLDEMQSRGFNWLRVWATWAGSGADVSAVDMQGHARQPYLDRLAWLVAECDRRGMILDVTLTRGKGAGSVADIAAHREAVRTIVGALRGHANWYLDLANERDVRDARFVSVSELRELRELAASLDPKLLVTASFGGQDLNESHVREGLIDAELDFLCPHRSRHGGMATRRVRLREAASDMGVVVLSGYLRVQRAFAVTGAAPFIDSADACSRTRRWQRFRVRRNVSGCSCVRSCVRANCQLSHASRQIRPGEPGIQGRGIPRRHSR